MPSWIRKFTLAAKGIWLGMRGQSSFSIHVPIAVCVIGLAIALRCLLWQWCALLLCIGLVMAAELANSAMEELAAALCTEHNAAVGRSLDIASGAVLAASLTAAAVGVLIFAERLTAL